jgi:aminoglycoside phosphotransferase (APT) family kinase protein
MIFASGVRITWADLPGHVRAAVEELIGAPVLSAESQTGGFSPGTADRVLTASGDRFFVKAVSPAQNTRSVEMARSELRIASRLPAEAPAPRLLGSFDDGDWVALIFEDVDGRHPRTPWVENELGTVLRALRDLADALTPSPVPDAPTVADHLAHDLGGWRRVAADPPAGLDPWVTEHLDALLAASERAQAALIGDTLVHCDVRADNMLLRPDGSLVFVDWPWGCLGPAWLDRALLALNVLVHGGDGDRILAELSNPADARDLIVALTGYFVDIARRPPPPGLPTVRAFQRFQAEALLPWLRYQMGPPAHPGEPGNPAH